MNNQQIPLSIESKQFEKDQKKKKNRPQGQDKPNIPKVITGKPLTK